MLNQLSGRTHQVVTGYALIRKAEQKLFTDAVRTDVSFKTLSSEEIEWYIHTSEPFDKAGGYAIQGLGTFLVKGIKGSYTNVVGLPVCEVIELLYREGVIRPGPGNVWIAGVLLGRRQWAGVKPSTAKAQRTQRILTSVLLS